MIQQILRKLFGSEMCTEELAYRRVAKQGYLPDLIIDGGAYEGHWSRLARKVFPDAPILLIEPQVEKQALLRLAIDEIGNARLHQGALAADSEEHHFFVMETGSSLLAENSNVAREVRTLRTEKLDSLLGKAKNIFLKLDVQGGELGVLAGGTLTLKACSLIQLEVALLPYNEGAPTFLQVVSYMNEQGFVPFDIVGFIRPDKVNLVQVDMLFVPKESNLRPTTFEY